MRPADTSVRAGRTLEWLLRALPHGWRDKTRDYLILTRMDRPIGALLLLWPTWWALWLAAGDFPPWQPLLVFTLGVFTMRAAGCAINDFADRKLDPQVARTAGRPIASGRVRPREAVAIFLGLLLVSFLLVLLTNRPTVWLSLGGAALAAIYPFCKRYTHLPQVVLGAAFGWAIPMAFCAVTGHVPALGWLLFLANVLWSVIYDTQYALVDREDDLRAGNKSTAILFGDGVRAALGLLILVFLAAMFMVGVRAGLAWPYWLALAGTAGLFAYQQRLLSGAPDSAGLTAFRNNNWVGLVIWLGIVLAVAIRPSAGA
ncbi:4-hydroxybenzoate octaprenyltransferase [Frateuria aurantia]